MPNLTGKELADLYPKAKSYDELRADSERIQQLRRLRFVPAKVALWTTLGTAVALVAGYLIPGILSGLSDDAMQVLTSVSFSGIVAVAALAIVFYLRSLIDDLASKIILSMSLLYTALGTIICITGGIFAFFVQYMGYDSVFAASLALPLTFFAAYAAVLFIVDYQ